MNLPIFFAETIAAVNETLVLPEESSKHIIQVLRMGKGEEILLTNGMGTLLRAVISDDHKKRTGVTVIHSEFFAAKENRSTIAISILKNNNRFEWFLEKATELGITEIIPLICERTERQHFRFDRMKAILVSAMLQSQQAWLPELSAPQPFREVIEASAHPQKFIAHCMQDDAKKEFGSLPASAGSRIILIGPEGDFSANEIHTATNKGFFPVSLGSTRLRTETAGMVAAVLLRT
jgi:16S rRNA (uracil1498-N3)-methyltransferase